LVRCQFRCPILGVTAYNFPRLPPKNAPAASVMRLRGGLRGHVTAKRQHTIPILHLKHFVGVKPKGQVWTIDKDTGETRSATPENTAVVSHFYSIEKEDGTFDTAFEGGLARIEGAAAPVYEKLIGGQTITDDDKSNFAAFLAVMHLRTTAMRA